MSINFRELVPSITNFDRATHFIHAYPAKLLQHIPHFFLNNNVLSSRNDLVFDPFTGSGTVALEAILAGRKAVGTDINPLSILIAKVKTTVYQEEEIRKVHNEILQSFEDIKKMDFGKPEVTNLSLWYSHTNIHMLMKLREIIEQVKNQEMKEFFQLAFSTCTRKFSFADPRISVPVRINTEKFSNGHWLKKHAQDHLDFVEGSDILSFFNSIVEKNIKRYIDLKHLLEKSQNAFPQANIYHHDIKSSQGFPVKPNSIQLIISSPPYVSAQKYIRSSRLNIEWLNLGDQPTKVYDQKSIGREHVSKEDISSLKPIGIKEVDEIIIKIFEKNKSRAYITHTYMLDMRETLIRLYEVLKINGYFVMIIGNNTIAGYEFLTHKYLIEMAEQIGFVTNLVLIDDIKSRGLMTNRNKSASVISREYVIVFKKKNYE